MLAGFFVALLMREEAAAWALLAAPIPVLFLPALLAPGRDATGRALGALLAQIGALAALSAAPAMPPIETTLIGEFRARVRRGFPPGPTGPARLLLDEVTIVDGDIVFEERALLDLPPDSETPPAGSRIAVAGLLETRPGGLWRLRGLPRVAAAEDDLEGAAWRLRRRLHERLEANLAPEALPWLAALVLGEGLVDEERRELLRRSGTGHFFVVSGLHVGLLAALLGHAAAILGFGRRGRSLLVLPGALAYALICGGKPPVMRAFALLGLLALADLMGRPTRPLRLLAALAALALIASPDLVRDPSFSFSFTAVAGILALALPPRDEQTTLQRFLARKRGRSRMRAAATTLRMSEAAFLATAPLALLHQGACAPATIPASLVLLPLVAALLPLGALALLAPLPAAPLRWLTQALEQTLALFGDLPGALLEPGETGTAGACLAWTALALAALLRQLRRRPAAARLIAWSGFLAMIAWTALDRGLELQPRRSEQALIVRAGGREHRVSTRRPEGRLIYFRDDEDEPRVETARVAGLVVALRLELDGHSLLVLGGEKARALELPFGPVDEVAFAGRCAAWEALAVMERFEARSFRAPMGLDPDCLRLLAAEGYLETGTGGVRGPD